MSRKSLWLVALLTVLTLSAFAEDKRSEVSLQGTGMFTKDSNESSLSHGATDSGGFLAGYRFNINKWAAAEANYGYSRNSQKYLSSVAGGGTALTSIPTNVHEVSGSFVFKVPTKFERLHPFASAGAGALIFDPRETGIASGLNTQTKAAFIYGGCLDYDLVKNVAFRAGYRGLVYKSPDFEQSSLNLDKVTHTAQPTAGIVFRF